MSKQFKGLTLFYLVLCVVLLLVNSSYLLLLSSIYIIVMQGTAFVMERKLIKRHNLRLSNLALFLWALFVLLNFFFFKIDSLKFDDKLSLRILFYLPISLFAFEMVKNVIDECKEQNSIQTALDLIMILLMFLILIRPLQAGFKALFDLEGIRVLIYDLFSIVVGLFFVLPFVFFTKYSFEYKNILKHEIIVISFFLMILANFLKFISLVYSLKLFSAISFCFALSPALFFISAFSKEFDTVIPEFIIKDNEQKNFIKGLKLNFFFLFILLLLFFAGHLALEFMTFLMLLIFVHMNINLWLNSLEARNKLLSMESKNDTELEYKASLKTEELKNVYKKLLEKINTDSLTGLKSNHFFISKVSDLIEAGNHKFSLIAINIDDFRNINNTYGHDVGDEVLLMISKRLSEEFSENADLIRLRGDEFGILFLTDSQKVIEDMYNRLLSILDGKYYIGLTKLNIDFAISIARYPMDASTATEMLQKAGIAMNVAKERRSEKRMVYYTSDFIKNMENRNKLERAVKKIVVENEFKIKYSAQHDVKTDKIKAVSCLMFWDNAEFKSVPQKEFLSHLENFGILNDVYEWYIKELSEDLYKRLESGIVLNKVTIHISGVSLGVVSFLKVIVNALKSKGISENILEFALTSELLFDVYNQYPALLNSLSKDDITIALKDFGMGNSSLNLIKKANVSKIIVSNLLTEHLDTDNEDYLVVKSIMMIGNGLDIDLLANGIDRISQYSIVERMGCDLVSGSYLSNTLEPDAFWEAYSEEMV